MLFLLFLAGIPHHIAWGKMTRKNIKVESYYHGKRDMSIISINWHGSVEGKRQDSKVSEKTPQ